MKKIFLAVLLSIFLATSCFAGQLLPYPKFKATDAVGVPYSGGKLYTYAPGTSTAKAAYTDVNLTVPAANPIVLDSSGEAAVYLKGKYKIILKTSADVTVWTLDNVQGMGDWEEGRYYVDAGETDQGATGSGNSIAAHLVTIGSKNAVLRFANTDTSGTTSYTVSTSVIIPANVRLEFDPGAALVKGTGSPTVTINGPMEAERRQIFSGWSTGNIVFAAGVINEVYPEWWATNTTPGTTDMQSAIQCAIDALAGNPGTVSLAAQTYGMTSGVTATGNRQHIKGAGAQATTISLSPSGTTVVFTFGNSSGTPQVVNCSITGIGFTSSDTTYKKTMIRTYNIQKMRIADIMSPDGLWSGATSVGLNLMGADAYTVEQIQLSADIPIQISNNPSAGHPDIDHFVFRDVYLYATNSTNPCFLIDTGLLVQNLTWEGYNGFARGSYGIYWNDTTGASPALNLSFKNIRWEQSENNSGYFFLIERASSNVYQLNIENCYTASATYTYGFLRLKNVYYPRVVGSVHFCTTSPYGIYAYLSGIVSSLRFQDFMTLGTLTDATTYGLHKNYDSYDNDNNFSVVGNDVKYTHFARGPKIPVPIQSELGVYDNNFRAYSNGKGMVLTSPNGAVTKLIRLSDAGAVEVVELGTDTPPDTPPIPDAANLITTWANLSYDTFTNTAGAVTSAIYTTSGTQSANTGVSSCHRPGELYPHRDLDVKLGAGPDSDISQFPIVPAGEFRGAGFRGKCVYIHGGNECLMV